MQVSVDATPRADREHVGATDSGSSEGLGYEELFEF